MDGRPHGIQMTPPGGDLNTSELSVGRALISALPFFCALRNLSDCARLEMLQTEFRREMGCSESFVDVRDLPHPFGVGNGVGNPDDFGKNVRLGSLRCVRE